MKNYKNLQIFLLLGIFATSYIQSADGADEDMIDVEKELTPEEQQKLAQAKAIRELKQEIYEHRALSAKPKTFPFEPLPTKGLMDKIKNNFNVAKKGLETAMIEHARSDSSHALDFSDRQKSDFANLSDDDKKDIITTWASKHINKTNQALRLAEDTYKQQRSILLTNAKRNIDHLEFGIQERNEEITTAEKNKPKKGFFQSEDSFNQEVKKWEAQITLIKTKIAIMKSDLETILKNRIEELNKLDTDFKEKIDEINKAHDVKMNNFELLHHLNLKNTSENIATPTPPSTNASNMTVHEIYEKMTAIMDEDPDYLNNSEYLALRYVLYNPS